MDSSPVSLMKDKSNMKIGIRYLNMIKTDCGRRYRQEGVHFRKLMEIHVLTGNSSVNPSFTVQSL